MKTSTIIYIIIGVIFLLLIIQYSRFKKALNAIYTDSIDIVDLGNNGTLLINTKGTKGYQIGYFPFYTSVTNGNVNNTF